MGVLSAGGSVCFMKIVPMEAKEGHHIPWNWSYGWLVASRWELGMKPQSSERTTRAPTF